MWCFCLSPSPVWDGCTQVSQELMSANDTMRYVGNGDGEGDTERSEDFVKDGNSYDEAVVMRLLEIGFVFPFI